MASWKNMEKNMGDRDFKVYRVHYAIATVVL